MSLSTQCPLLRLPANILSQIVEYLPAVLDLLRLERTCKHVRSAIDWRSRLKDECDANKLFRPSFDHLQSRLELKRACIRGLVICQRYHNASRFPNLPGEEASISPTSAFIQLGNSGITKTMRDSEEGNTLNRYDPYSNVISASIVPGGRYIVVLQKGFVTMWDLHNRVKDRPTLCMIHCVPKNTGKVCNLTIEGTSVVQVLLRVLSHDPDVPPRTRKTDACFRFCALEIRKDNSTAGRFVCQGSCVTLGLPEEFKLADVENGGRGFVGGKVLWALPKKKQPLTLILWDFKKKSTAVWQVPDALGGHTEHMICGSYILQGATYGASAVKIPNFKPLPSTGLVQFFRKTGLKVKPMMTIWLKNKFPSKRTFASRSGVEYLDYQLLSTDPKASNGIAFRRFRLAFDTIDPSKSGLWETHALSYHGASDEPMRFTDSPSLRLRLGYCDGGQVMSSIIAFHKPGRWADPGINECSISMRRWTQGPGSKTDAYTSRHPLDPTESRNYLQFSSSKGRALSDLLMSSFCPASGKAVTVWKSDPDVRGVRHVRIEVHEF